MSEAGQRKRLIKLLQGLITDLQKEPVQSKMGTGLKKVVPSSKKVKRTERELAEAM